MVVGVATLHDNDGNMTNGANMPKLRFLWNTGATQTTIPKKRLTEELGYTEAYIAKNKILLEDEEKPTLADGTKADVYKLPATRMNIGGHEIDYVYTSDTLDNLSLLLGFNVLGNFKFTFDLDVIDGDAPHGRMFYEFRKNRIKSFTKLGEPFAYQMNSAEVSQQEKKPLAPKTSNVSTVSAVGRILNRDKKLIGLVLSDGREQRNFSLVECISFSEHGKIKNVKVVPRNNKKFLSGNGVSLESLPYIVQ